MTMRGDAAGDDECNRQRLGPETLQITKQLDGRARACIHQLNSAAARRASLLRSREIWPSAKESTRSATSWMLALWVMMRSWSQAGYSHAAAPRSRECRFSSPGPRSARRTTGPPGAWRSRARSRHAAARRPRAAPGSGPCGSKPDQGQRLLGPHRMLGDLGHQCDVLIRREARYEVVELKHEPDVAAPKEVRPAIVQGRQLRSLKNRCPLVA